MMLDGCHNTTELTFLSKVHQNSDVLNPQELYCTCMKNTADMIISKLTVRANLMPPSLLTLREDFYCIHQLMLTAGFIPRLLAGSYVAYGSL